MTSRISAVLALVLAAASPVLGQTDFAEFGQTKEETLPQPSAPALPNLPDSPASPAPSTKTPDPAKSAVTPPEPVYANWSIVPPFLKAWAPGGDPKYQEHWWINGDYLEGWTRDVGLPALVTTSPKGTVQAKAGVLGEPGTTVLFGDHSVDGGSHTGFKAGAGCWFTDDRTLGFDLAFWYLGTQSTDFLASSNGSTILARPFTNANSKEPASLLVAFPLGSGPAGVKAAGSIAAQAMTGPVYGAHFDFREVVIRDPNFRLTTLLGYRFLRVSDSLNIEQSSDPTGPGFVAGTQINSQDSFRASNMFNGCDIGFEAEYVQSRWSLGWIAKVAAGQARRDIDVSGSTQIIVPGSATSNLSGGLLALSPNIGDQTSSVFSVIPETSLYATWIINDHVRFRVGYTALLFVDAVRAADQVDTTVNPKLIPTPLGAPTTPGLIQRPMPMFNQSNMWIQTVNAGLEIRF